MEQQQLWKKIMPHAIAIAVMLLVLVIYFKEVVVGNKVIQQGDVKNFLGMSKEVVDYRNADGQEPLWAGNMFSGMPAYQISVKMFGNWAQYLDLFLWKLLQRQVAILFMTMLGFYVLLNSLKLNPYLSLAGALAYGLSSYFFIIVEAGHNSKLWAISYMAWVLAGLIMAYNNKNRWLGACVLGISLSMEIFSNHLQITYYLFLIILIYGIVELIAAIKQKQLKDFAITSGFVVGAALIAVLMNSTLLMSTSEYTRYSTRGKTELTQVNAKSKSTGLDPDYAFGWSYGVSESFTLMIPRFMGGSSNENKVTTKALKEVGEQQEGMSFPTYWGDKPFTSGPVYVGAIVCFLFVFAMFIVEHRYKWWLFSATVLSLFLAWGRNFEGFNMLFFNNFPGYNKFRTVEMILVIAELTMPLLGFMALARLTQGELDVKKTTKQLYYALGITGGLCLFFALLGPGFMNFTGPVDKRIQQPEFVQMLKDERSNMLRMDALRSLVFIGLGAGLVWAYLQKRIQLMVLAVSLIVLITIDMSLVNRRYVNASTFVEPTDMEVQAYDADNFIRNKDKSYYRVFAISRGDLTGDSHTPYFHKSLGGYHGAKLKRYQELIDAQLEKINPNVVNMLNTKYFVINQQAIIPTNLDTASVKMSPGTEILTKSKEGEYVLLNKEAYGNAWITPKVKVVATPDEALQQIGTTNSKYTAIVEKSQESLLKTVSSDSVKKTETISLKGNYHPRKLSYEVSVEKDRFVTFSEIYYPKGWKAMMEGKELPIIQTNYVLRGLIVPAGKHTIDFVFEPSVYQKGEKISTFASIIMLLFTGWVIFLGVRKKKA